MGSLVEIPVTFEQPYKGMFIAYQCALLFVLIPVWTFYYTFYPRPRPTWTLRESVDVKIIRKLVEVNTRCLIEPLCSDKKEDVPQSSLKETSFCWLEPADRFSMIRDVAADSHVYPIHVPGYVWPKNADVHRKEGLFGIFFHGGGWGGGYTMGNAGEAFGDSDIARKLSKGTDIKTILSVDYRLTCEACHPAQLLDTMAAYAHVTGFWHVDPSRIVVIGTCGGAHLALMLLRYLDSQKVLPLPCSLILFSPWIDMALDQMLYLSPGKARPNADVDVVVTSHIDNLRFLGHHPVGTLTSPYFSANLAPPGTYMNYPMTYLCVGDCETFHKESLQLIDLMRGDGVDVTLDLQPDAVHNFLAQTHIPVPSRAAKARVMENVTRWINNLSESRQGSAV